MQGGGGGGMQGLQGWQQAEGSSRGMGDMMATSGSIAPAPTVNRGSGPISINTHQVAPSARSSLPRSLLSPTTPGSGGPRSAAHPYYPMSAPLRSAGAQAHPDKVSTPSSSLPPEVQVLHYPGGSPNNGLKQSPRRRQAPSFPRSVRGSAQAQEDYCETPSVLRVPPSPRDPRNMMYGLSTPLTPSHSLPYGMPTSNIRGGAGDSSDGSLRQRRASSSTSRATAKLDGIPHAYVVKSLRKLAPQFWNKAETADCRILVPLRHEGQTTPSPTTSLIAQLQSSKSPATPAAPAFSPATLAPPVVPQGNQPSPTASAFSPIAAGPLAPGERKILTYPLHSDYLTTQSTLLRSLFHDGTTPTARRSSEATPTGPTGPSAASGSASEQDKSSNGGDSPAKSRGARVLATPAAAPTTIWLPLPDPGSFGVILHWLYWGDAAALDTALSKGIVSWQGIVKNIEYLGLDDSIKRVMGVWWRRWVKVAAGRKESERRQSKSRASDRQRSESVDAEGDTSMSEAGAEDDQGDKTDAEATDVLSLTDGAAKLSGGSRDAIVQDQRDSDVDGDVAGRMQAL